MSLEIVLPRSPLADLIRETAASWPPRGKGGEEVLNLADQVLRQFDPGLPQLSHGEVSQIRPTSLD